MSDTLDFQERSKSDTAAHGSPVPLPPLAEKDTLTDRRGSTSSHRTAGSTKDLRFRRMRSNTVATYQEAEHAEPSWMPGAEPGIDTSIEDENQPSQLHSLKTDCEILIIDFAADQDMAPRHIRTDNEGLSKVLARTRPNEYTCRWISVNGLSWDVIKCLSKTYNLHPLATEDVVHTHTRTKVDWYADHACVILTLQKLVRLHQHRGSDEDCDCEDDNSELDEKTASRRHDRHTSRRKWWQRKTQRNRKSSLPYYIDKNDDGRVDEFVHAHSGTSENAPIRQVRTLHRYESSQIPEHTAFLEKHSSLAGESLAVSVEQVAIFLLADNTVISFFEQSAEDVERPIRERLQSPETIIRRSCDASMLLQAIIDAIVDLAIPVKEAYNKARKELQVDAMVNPNIATSRALHIFGEEIDMLQNLIKPIVHLVNALRDHNNDPLATAPTPPSKGQMDQNLSPPTITVDDTNTQTKQEKNKRARDGRPMIGRKLSTFSKSEPLKRSSTATSVAITPLAHTYFGDVYDNCITLIQSLEQMDASATNISTLIFNTVGARTNNFMMILAVVTVFFSPLTFISGYFGMNFARGDGLAHPFAFFWVISIPILVGFMALVFITMLWDNIRDWLSKSGIRSHRNKRNKMRRTKAAF